MPYTFNRQILFLFMLVIVTKELSFAQVVRDSPQALSLSVALLNVSDTSDSKVVWKPFDAVTIIKQAGNGILYGALLGAGGGLIGLGVGLSTPVTGKDDFHTLGDIGIGFGVGAVLGVMWGVYNAGDSDGGNGTVLGTILGTAGAAIIPLLLINSNSETAGPKSRGYALAPFALFIGPILGYHFSATQVYGSKNPGGRAQLMITPLFGQRSSGIQVAFTF
jgi:hypothetical protein